MPRIGPGGPFLRPWSGDSTTAAVAATGSAVGVVGTSSSSASAKGATTAIGLGAVGLSSVETARKAATTASALGAVGLSSVETGKRGALGSSISAVGMAASETGAEGARVPATGVLGLSSSELGKRNVTVSGSSGRIGLTSTESSSRGATSTAIGNAGLSSTTSGGQIVSASGFASGVLGIASITAGAAGPANPVIEQVPSGGFWRRIRRTIKRVLSPPKPPPEIQHALGRHHGALGLTSTARGEAFVKVKYKSLNRPIVASGGVFAEAGGVSGSAQGIAFFRQIAKPTPPPTPEPLDAVPPAPPPPLLTEPDAPSGVPELVRGVGFATGSLNAVLGGAGGTRYEPDNEEEMAFVLAIA